MEKWLQQKFKTNMRKLIKISESHYVIVNNAEIQKGDWTINNLDKTFGKLTAPLSEGEIEDKEYSKIIFSTIELDGVPLINKNEILDYL